MSLNDGVIEYHSEVMSRFIELFRYFFFVLEGSAQEFCFGHIIVSISDIWFLNVIGSLCFFVSNECTHILKNVLEV